MEILELPGWRIEYDRPATIAAHGQIVSDGVKVCSCAPCRNWARTRERLYPPEFRLLLDRIGIRFDREAEVYHNCRLPSKLHSYAGWYHFVGNVQYGEKECSPHVPFDRFSVYFHSRPALLSQALASQPVVQLEFEAEVPWLSEIPESA